MSEKFSKNCLTGQLITKRVLISLKFYVIFETVFWQFLTLFRHFWSRSIYWHFCIFETKKLRIFKTFLTFLDVTQKWIKTDFKMNISWPKAAFNKIVCEINLIISLLWLLMTEPGHLYSNNHKISHYKLNQVLTDIVLSFNRVTMLRNLARTWLLTKPVFEPEFKTRNCFGPCSGLGGMPLDIWSIDVLFEFRDF